MSRLRRYLPPLVILLPLIFVCGKLLLTPVSLEPAWDYLDRGVERGWPWSFQSFEGDYDEYTPLPGIGDGPIHFGVFVADLAVMLLAIGACAALLAPHYRRRGKWFRFSLRELFVVSTVACLAVGWTIHDWVEWQRKRFAIEELSRHQISETGDRRYYGPQWICRFLDNESLGHYYYREGLEVAGTANDESWSALEQVMPRLPHIHYLRVAHGPIRIHDETKFRGIELLGFSNATDGHLVGIGRLAGLKELSLGNGRLTVGGIAQIADCSSLEKLYLAAAEIEPGALEPLGRSRSLQDIDLTMTKVTDADVTHLASISSLRTLTLEATRAGDDCLEALQKLPRLESLNLRHLRISDAGARRLLEYPSLKSVKFFGRQEVSNETLDLLRSKIEHVDIGEVPNR